MSVFLTNKSVTHSITVLNNIIKEYKVNF